jgi:phosphopentomutase
MAGTNSMERFGRILLVVLDSAGIGALPDAADWGDSGTDTLGHVLEVEKPRLPHLQQLGLANIRPLPNLPAVDKPEGAFGKAAIFSRGKDTTVGHWEMAGVITPVPFPTFPHGFPDRILDPFRKLIGSDVLGNKPASGTVIIQELGEEHIRSGKPIVYTSVDSVFQIAAHEEVIPLDRLYSMCEIARKILDGRDRVARVIARPFVGTPGHFQRTGNRKDFAILPPEPTLLDVLKEQGLAVVAIGKIASIFDYQGVTEDLPAHSNAESVDQAIAALGRASDGLIFTNLVDFDMLWGHRRDSTGYARGLEQFDERLPALKEALRDGDGMIICADHGNDPTASGSDHTREYVPMLMYGRKIKGGVNLGTRSTLADIGQSIADNFGLRLSSGTSFLNLLQ